MFRRIDHIGVVVPDLARAKTFVERLGCTLEFERELPHRNVKAAFYRVGDGDGARIELIEPTSADTRARRLTEDGAPRIEHIAMETDDEITTVMTALRGLGVDFVAPEPVSIDGNLNAFTRDDTSAGIQFQIVERDAARD